MSSVSPKVLLIDDDASYRRLCQRWLLRDTHHSYFLDMCDTGENALRKCLETSFDCLLIDYRLPDMTGTEFVSALRKSLGDQTPGIVIMSANGGEDAATQAVRVDAADFIAKNIASAAGVRRSVANTIKTEKLRHDIRKRQNELEMAHVSLQVQRNKLEQANDALVRRNTEIQSFYHTLSHEMKTPLTAAREFVSIVHDQIVGELNSEQQKILSMSLSCCDQISRQFHDLLDMTRLDTGKFKITVAPTNIRSMLERAVEITKIAAAENSIRIDTRGLESLPKVMMDEGRISANDLSKVFDRLYQVDRLSPSNGDNGLGLGLSISQQIVKQHGNQLKVASREGLGSCFSFELSIANDADEHAKDQLTTPRAA